MQHRHLRLEIFLTFSKGFGGVEAHFLIKSFLIKKTCRTKICKQNMFKVKKKYTITTSANCVFMSIDVVQVFVFVNFGHITHRFLVFCLLSLNR